MCLQPEPVGPVPEDTARVAHLGYNHKQPWSPPEAHWCSLMRPMLLPVSISGRRIVAQ